MKRGPVFDGTQDWRHSVFLTGRAARKEVYYASESPENQRLLLAAMEREWRKWEEHKATLPLTQGELSMLKSRFPNLKIVGTRWVLTPKELPGGPFNDALGLSVQAAQEDSFSVISCADSRTLAVVFCRCLLLHICKQQE